MKGLMVIVAIIVLVAKLEVVQSKMTVAQVRNAIKGMRKTCSQKIGVSDDVLNAANNGEFPPDPKLQCYHKCLLEMLKAIKNEKLNINMMQAQAEAMLTEDVATKLKGVLEKCTSETVVTSDDLCVASWEFVKCYYVTDNSVYFFP